jgi:predicted ATPase
MLQLGRDDAPQEKLSKLEEALVQYHLPLPEVVPLFASLLSLPLPERYPPLSLSPQRQKEKTLEAVLGVFLAMAARRSVLLIVEDLHWVDPSTLELLTLILDQTPTARVLTLFTARSEFRPPWPARSHLTLLTLTRFTRKQTEVMVERVSGGKALPIEVLQQVVTNTDGVPLFVEEVTKAILESGLLRETDDHYELTRPLPAVAIPSTIQDSLMARLDRLPTVKVVAQLAATIGRHFSYELLQAVSLWDAPTLERDLRRLVEAELLYQRRLPPQATYTFKHAPVQEVAYQSLLRSTRQQYHQRIAQVLAERFPETAETQPELLAHHFTEAGLKEQAIAYWQRAGQRAIQRSANIEAIAYLSKGLDLVKTLPDAAARAQHELGLQVALGVPLIATRGYTAPEVEKTYARARELCLEIGETLQMANVLWALWAFYIVRGKLHTALEIGEQYRALAERTQATPLLLETCQLMGITLFHLGELGAARPHLERGVGIYDPRQHHSLIFEHGGADTGLAIQTHLALLLWQLGYPSQARANMQEALTLAQKLSHPFSLSYMHFFFAWFHELCGDERTARTSAEASMRISAEYGLPFWGTLATVLRGWALAEEGALEEGIAEVRQGLTFFEVSGAQLFQTYPLGLLAETYGKTGRPDQGLTVLIEALAVVDRSDEHYWEAELYRLRGELMLALPGDNRAEVERCFREAIQLARQRSQKSLELRAAMSLSRLWQKQGKLEEARPMLAEIYGWFTEGFDTRDLREAKALLEQLS